MGDGLVSKVVRRTAHLPLFSLTFGPKRRGKIPKSFICRYLRQFCPQKNRDLFEKWGGWYLTGATAEWYTDRMKKTTIYPKSIKAPNEFSTLKKGSSNKKLGFKITAKKWGGKRLYSLTLTERNTCPASCHHWEDCYGNHMPFAHRFSTIGLTDKLEIEIAALLKKHKNGIVIRLHVLGDFYSTDYVKFWERILSQNPTLCVFGYTGRETNTCIGNYIRFINNLYSDRCVIRFSRSKESKDGILYAAEESYTGKHFDCPEQTGKIDSCAKCGLCWISPRTVRFITH